MAERLTDTLVKNLAAPTKGQQITRDTEVKGFGVRVTATGARSFVLNYRTRTGRERRITIGSFPDWSTAVAREEAKELKRQVDRGDDPMAEIEADRNAKTIADLCDRFIADHLPKRRPATIRDYTAIINNEIRPALKHELVAELRHDKVDELHRKITKTGKKTKANRAVAVLSKMLNDAAKWGWRSGDNPARGIEKNAETKRKTYLKPNEIAKLGAALDAYPIRERKDGTTYVDARALQSANAIRLLMLTGARSGEVQALLHPGAGEKPVLQRIVGQLAWQRPDQSRRGRTLQIILHGAARDAQPLCNLATAGSVAGEPQHLS